MTLIARASKTVRIKNLIIVAMCVIFCAMFLYDGFYTYPARNDAKVRSILSKDPGAVTPSTRELVEKWIAGGGWAHVSDDMHDQMDAAIKKEADHIGTEGWKNPNDVRLQRELGWGLVACVIASVWWFVHCQRRRAIAEAATVSPAPGVIIPWDKITKVDNTRWKTVGIVDISYTDAQGQSKQASFDDYKLQREPLLGILDQLSEKAAHAEFIDPKDESKPAKESAEPAKENPASSGTEESSPPRPPTPPHPPSPQR